MTIGSLDAPAQENPCLVRVVMLAAIAFALLWFATLAVSRAIWKALPAHWQAFSWTNGYVSHCALFLVALSVVALLRPSFHSDFGLKCPRGKSFVGVALVSGLVCGPLMLVVDDYPQLLAHHVPDGPYGLSASNVIPWLLMQGVFVGIAEEMAFRSMLLGYLLCLWPRRLRLFRFDISAASILVALMFSISHAGSFWNEPFAAALGQQIYAAAFAIFYAYLFEKSGSLLAPALAHNSADFIEWAARFGMAYLWA